MRCHLSLPRSSSTHLNTVAHVVSANKCACRTSMPMDAGDDQGRIDSSGPSFAFPAESDIMGLLCLTRSSRESNEAYRIPAAAIAALA